MMMKTKSTETLGRGESVHPVRSGIFPKGSEEHEDSEQDRGSFDPAEAPGRTRIEKFRAIVEARSVMMVEGQPVDLFSGQPARPHEPAEHPARDRHGDAGRREDEGRVSSAKEIWRGDLGETVRVLKVADDDCIAEVLVVRSDDSRTALEGEEA
jgi:hypothetical protein